MVGRMNDQHRVFEIVQISAKGMLGLMVSTALVAATAAHLMTPTMLPEGSVLRCYEVFEPPVVTRAIPGEAS